MFEVVFSDSTAGAMAFAMGHKKSGGRARAVIFGDDSAISQEDAEKLLHRAEERERIGWENAVPLVGNQDNILSFPLALSVGGISENGIGSQRKSALSMLFGTLPNIADDVTAQLISTSQNSIETLLKQAQNGKPIRIWAGHSADEICGLHWLMEQLRPIGFEKLNITLVELPPFEERQDGSIVRYSGFGEVEPHNLGRLAARVTKLPANYLRSLANHWRGLQEENSPLRAVINGVLVSVSDNLYDTFILRELAAMEEKFNEAVLVGRVLGKYQLGLGDCFISLRIEKFIKDGLLLPVTTPAPNMPVYHRILRKVK